MSLKDLRVQYPLWNVALFLIFMIFAYGVVHWVDALWYDSEIVVQFTEEGSVWNIGVVFSTIAGLGLFTLFFLLYTIKWRKHNKANPNQKMPFLTIKPGEFIEDDELLNRVTQNATRKVYTLYTNALPIIVMTMFFPLDRYFYILMVFALLIIHNLIYYLDMRQFVQGTYNFSKKKQQPINLSKLLGIVTVSTLIVAMSVIVIQFIRIDLASEQNGEILEECLDKGGKAVIEKDDGFFNVAKVSCEK
ncbi:hypothetical protein ACTWQB_04480 [Piscibacillus sp. B03]|uniref:hypothetical protein n=1 Tax=Piscibacillus sp. B03 TaxID=3457430 RepID=UPI003FCE1ED5